MNDEELCEACGKPLKEEHSFSEIKHIDYFKPKLAEKERELKRYKEACYNAEEQLVKRYYQIEELKKDVEGYSKGQNIFCDKWIKAEKALNQKDLEWRQRIRKAIELMNVLVAEKKMTKESAKKIITLLEV